MSTITANIGLTLPTLDGDPGIWDGYWNGNGALIDLHDHSTGKGVKVTPTGLNINADLTFAGYSATNLRAAVFTAQASFATALAIYVKTNDLYFRDGASNEVRLTASGALNIATTGGIAGDYIAASAQVYYDDANKTYRFLEAAPPNNWSYIACGGVDLYQQGLGITNRVRLSSPNALAASYECVFPAGLPADTSLLQITAAGVMTFTNAIGKPVTMGSTLGVTGLITATAGLTAAANQHITVSGTGEYKHGDKVKVIGFAQATISGAVSFNAADSTIDSTGLGYATVSVPFNVGDRVKTATARIFGDAACTVEVYITLAIGDGTDTFVTNSGEVPAAAWATSGATTSLATTLTANHAIRVTVAFDATGGRAQNVAITFDHP